MIARLMGLVACAALAAPVDAQVYVEPTFPLWGYAPPTEVLEFDYDPALTDADNGYALRNLMLTLTPGQMLMVGGGTYSTHVFWNLELVGTAQAPIFIVAKPGEVPIITRPNAAQNVLNMGNSAPARYIALIGFEITGGSAGIRLLDCENIWIDSCHIHDTAAESIVANTHNTKHLYITRNHIHHTLGNTGEAMYLGAHDGTKAMSESIVAYNYVHDTGGTQGDGIEVKQNSWGNWVMGNEVHTTLGPGIIAYGTQGAPVNVIERNLVWNSKDNGIQVQGDAWVYNNVVVGANSAAFHSHDHEGLVQNLRVEQNTFISQTLGARLFDWDNRPGMFWVNNATYCSSSHAIRFKDGSTGVTLARNVILGQVEGADGSNPLWFIQGNGLTDFEDATWTGVQGHNARPTPGSPLIDYAHPFFKTLHGVDRDHNNMPRGATPDVGAFEEFSWGEHYGAGSPGQGGVVPGIRVNSAPTFGNPGFEMQLYDAPPGEIAIAVLSFSQVAIPWSGWTLWSFPWSLTGVPIDANGEATLPLPIPNVPEFDGLSFYGQYVVTDPWQPQGWGFTGGLKLTLGVD